MYINHSLPETQQRIVLKHKIQHFVHRTRENESWDKQTTERKRDLKIKINAEIYLMFSDHIAFRSQLECSDHVELVSLPLVLARIYPFCYLRMERELREVEKD